MKYAKISSKFYRLDYLFFEDSDNLDIIFKINRQIINISEFIILQLLIKRDIY